VPQTPLGDLTALPQLDFANLLLRGGEEKGRKEERVGERGRVRITMCFSLQTSKFTGYVAANVQLYRQRNGSSRCLHKVLK